MEKTTIEQWIIDMGVKQLIAFKDFQDRELGGMTVRDFDVWIGGYISGISHFYSDRNKNLTEDQFKEELRLIAQEIAESKIAKEIGVTGTELEEITTFNVNK